MEQIAYLKIRNWDKYQHYKDRNPPWVKLHSDILENYEFHQLSDSDRYHAIAIMLLASRTSNKIPYDNKWVASKISSTTKVDLDRLISVEFLTWYDLDSRVLASGEQDATQRQRQRQSRDREEKDIGHLNGFSKFWELYPRKKNKQQALKAWKPLSKNERGKATSHVGNQIESEWLSKDLQYIPYPASYLNAKRWEDEPDSKTERHEWS